MEGWQQVLRVPAQRWGRSRSEASPPFHRPSSEQCVAPQHRRRLSHPPVSWGGALRAPDPDLSWYLSPLVNGDVTGLFHLMTEHVCLGGLSTLHRVRRTNFFFSFLKKFF